MKPLIHLLLILFYAEFNLAQYPAFQNYSIENGGPSNEIYSILQDSDGYIWLGSDAGVYRFNGIDYEHFGSKELLARSATNLIQTASGRIYGYNFKGQIFFIDKGQLNVIKDWEKPLNGLTHDDQGQIWISAQEGCFILDDRTHEIRKFNSKLLFTNNYKLEYTNSIVRSKSGNIIFQNTDQIIELSSNGTEKSYRVKLKDRSIPLLVSKSSEDTWLFSFMESTIFRKNNDQWVPYTDVRLTELYEGRKPTSIHQIENDLWICTHTGVIRLELKTGNCELLYPHMAIADCIKDNEGNYWFTTLHHGVLKIPSLNLRSWNRNNGLDGLEQISHIALSDDQLIGAGTNGNLLFLDKNSKKKEIKHHMLQSDIGMLYYDEIDKCIYFNKLSFIYQIRDGQIQLVNDYARAIKDMLHTTDGYFMASSQGLYLTKKIQTNLSNDNMIASGWYREICPSPFGKGYFVAGNDGLFQLDEHKGKWIFTNNLLPKKQILSLSVDKQQKLLYVLTFDGEILCIDAYGKRKVFKADLESYRPIQIRCYKGHLYLATVKGVVQLNLKSGLKTVLNSHRGLISNNIRYISILKDTCWVASGKGLMCIPIQNFNIDLPLGKVVDRGIEIDSVSYKSTIIPQVNYNNILTIYVDGLSYYSNGDFDLAYRILGHSDDWIKVPGYLGKIDIQRLPSGELDIEVKMIDYLGRDSINTLHYKVNVIPPFWERWWFYVLIFMLVALLIYPVFLLRIRNIRKKQQQALKQMALENELRMTQQNALKAQMNPHFLFNVLNSIKGFIYENDKKNAARYLSDFSNLVRRILEMSSQPTVSLEKELEALKIYIDLEAMLLQSDLTCVFTVHDDVDTARTHIPSLLIQPYVENAIKHGLRHKEGKKILKIEVAKIDDTTMEILITDNGIGRTASHSINQQTRLDHKSFATDALKKRLELLNFGMKELVGIEIIDNFNEEGSPSGTTVKLQIHV